MIMFTADPHGDFNYIQNYLSENTSSKEDVMFILGDMELNTGNFKQDSARKQFLSSMPLTFLCIHGNHEIRPRHIESYRKVPLYESSAWVEKEYPNIYFLDDGNIYRIEGKTFLVIGGAYSVTRLLISHKSDIFCEDEQPSYEAMCAVDEICTKRIQVDFVLSHTCPYSFIPYDACTLPIEQSLVDRSTEKWMQKIYESLSFRKWFCGHYHTNRTADRITFLYKEIYTVQ